MSIPINKTLKHCIQLLIDERGGISRQIERLKCYEETLINDTRHFKRLLKRRIEAKQRNNAVDNLSIRLIMSVRSQKREDLWNNLKQEI